MTDKEVQIAYDDVVLRTHVELDSKDYNIVRDSTADGTGGLWSPETNINTDALTLKSLFFSEDWVFILIDCIASDISMVPLRVMKSEIVDGDMVRVPAEGHELQKVLNHPNEFQDYHNWMYSLVADLNITGNAIEWWAPATQQLMNLPSEMVQPSFDKNHNLTGYKLVHLSPEDVPVTTMNFPVENIVHIQRPNPSSLAWGLSPLLPGKKSILFNRFSTEYLNNYYIKGAQPGLALQIDASANEASALRLLKSFEMAYTGRRNQRRSMILPKGVTAKEISHNLADQQLKDYLVLNRETIINLLKVPKHKLSIADSGSLGSEEYKTAMKIYWGSTLKSQMEMIAGALTRKLAEQLGDDHTIEFDCSEVDAFKDDENAKADLATKMLATHTLNEVRQKLYNDPPLDGGDRTPGTPYAPTFQPPVASVEEVIEETADEEKSLGDSKELRANPLEKFSLFIKGKGQSWWQQREETLAKEFEKTSKKMNSLAVSIFADQAVEAVKAIQSTVKEKARVPSKTELNRKIGAALAKMEAEWKKGYTKNLEGTVEIGYDVGLKLPFGLQNEGQLEAIRLRNENGRRAVLEERGLDTFDNMNKTTTEKIMREIEAGIKEGESVDDIAKRVATKLTDAGEVSSRAMTIARTETLTASSLGQAAVMEDAATVIPNLKKMWVNGNDERVRGNPGGLYKNSEADHWALGGEMVNWNGKFTNGLEFPRDPAGGPGETINCRCTFVMFPADEADSFTNISEGNS